MYIMTLGMDGAFIRFYNEPPSGNTINQLLYKNIIITTFVVVFSGCICCLFFGDTISYYIFEISNSRLIVMVFAYTFCQVILRFLNIKFRMGFKVTQYTIQNIIINCLSKTLMLIGAFFLNEYFFIIKTITIGTFLVLIIYLFIQWKEIIPVDINGNLNISLDLKNFGPYFRYAVFSAPTYIVSYLNTFLGQQIVKNHLSAYSLGIYSSTNTFSTILTSLKGGFSTFWSAYIYKNYENKKEKITEMHDYIVFLSLILASGMVVFRDLIYLVIGSEYHESKRFFSLLLIMPFLGFISETTSVGIALAKKSEINLLAYISSVVCNLYLCIAWIPYFGLPGAAFANAVSGIVLFLISSVWGQKFYKSIGNIFRSSFGIIILMMILVWPAVNTNIFHIICFTTIMDLLALVIYRMQFKKIINMGLLYINSKC